MSLRRALVMLLALSGLYAATLPVPAREGGRDYSDAEAHALLAARSLARDGDVDLRNDYAEHGYRDFHRGPLAPTGSEVAGRVVEPTGLGYPALAAPAYALAGATGVALESALLLALAFVLACALARRLVPEPWATGGVALAALSVPALAGATAATPQAAAAAALVGACLLALRVRDQPGWRVTLGAGVLVATLPWLAPPLLLPAAVLAGAVWRWAARGRRPLRGLLAAEIVLTSVVTWTAFNEGLFGGWTPISAAGHGGDGTFAGSPGGYLDRLSALAGTLIDRSVGLLRWAPLLALALFTLWSLWRLRRAGLARALPGQGDVDGTAGLLAAVCGAQLLAAALFAPPGGLGAFPARALLPALPLLAALAAWGLRRARRTGAVLGALTLIASGWLLVAIAAGGANGWDQPGEHPPWGVLLPRFGTDTGTDAIVAVACALALLAVVALAARRARPAGARGA